MTAAPIEIPQWAHIERPPNVRATGSHASEQYVPLTDLPDVYTHAGHAAQYGEGRRNDRTVRLAILHTTESTSFQSSMTYDAWRAEQVSATAHVGPRGEIACSVPEHDRPWTTGRWNDESLSVEIIGRAAWTAAQWRARPLQLEALTVLLTDWCRRYQLPAEWLDAAAIAEGASLQGHTPRQGINPGICDHATANVAAIALGGSPGKYSHTDIGAGLRSVVIADIVPEVAARLAGTSTPHRWRSPMITGLHMLDDDGVRIIDTREGPHHIGPHARFLAGESYRIDVPDPGDGTGRETVAALVHLTTVGAAGPGYLACTSSMFAGPSRVNYAPGDPSPKTDTTVVNVTRDGHGAYFLARAFVHDVDVIVELLGVLS